MRATEIKRLMDAKPLTPLGAAEPLLREIETATGCNAMGKIFAAYPPKEESCVMEPEDLIVEAVTREKRNIAAHLRGIIARMPVGFWSCREELENLAENLEKPI